MDGSSKFLNKQLNLALTKLRWSTILTKQVPFATLATHTSNHGIGINKFPLFYYFVIIIKSIQYIYENLLFINYFKTRLVILLIIYLTDYKIKSIESSIAHVSTFVFYIGLCLLFTYGKNVRICLYSYRYFEHRPIWLRFCVYFHIYILFEDIDSFWGVLIFSFIVLG